MWDQSYKESTSWVVLLLPPVMPFYCFFFGGGFLYKSRLQKKQVGYPYSNLSTGGPSHVLGFPFVESWRFVLLSDLYGNGSFHTWRTMLMRSLQISGR